MLYWSWLHSRNGFKKDKIQFDYAYVPYGELGSTHRVSFGMKF